MPQASWRAFGVACAWLAGYAAVTAIATVLSGPGPAHFVNPLALSLGLLYLVVKATRAPLGRLAALSTSLGLWHGVLALAGRAVMPSDSAAGPAKLLVGLAVYAAAGGTLAGAGVQWQLRRRGAGPRAAGSGSQAT